MVIIINTSIAHIGSNVVYYVLPKYNTGHYLIL